LKSRYKQFDKKEIKLELKENGALLKEQTIKIYKKQRIFWMLIGVATGIALYKLLNLI
jgi:type IV secretory pathway component VirB8